MKSLQSWCSEVRPSLQCPSVPISALQCPSVPISALQCPVSALQCVAEGCSRGQHEYCALGGSYVDSIDGSWNHRARASTRMGNTADSGSHNSGFRCARDGTEGTPLWTAIC